MNWLEMISIRTAGPAEAMKVLEFCRECCRSVADALSGIAVYRSARYETDITIHLQWNADPGQGSRLGFELESALSGFGLINHTYWIEDERSKAAPGKTVSNSAG